ncbi:MAG: hypothetical protein ACRDP1_15035 [Nocardioidaceae bacterium]
MMPGEEMYLNAELAYRRERASRHFAESAALREYRRARKEQGRSRRRGLHLRRNLATDH